MKNKKAKTALDNLKAASRLLRTRWVDGNYAENKDGGSVSPRSEEAHLFCSIGAVRHIDGPGEKEALQFLRKAARLELLELEVDKEDLPSGNSLIIEVNDEYGYKNVKNMFQRAIALAKS